MINPDSTFAHVTGYLSMVYDIGNKLAQLSGGRLNYGGNLCSN